MNSYFGIITLGAINLFERTALYILMGIIIKYMNSSLGLSYSEAGTLYSIFYASTYVPVIFSGLIGDFTKRKTLILIGIITMVVGYIMLSTPLSDSSAIFPGLLVIIGVGSGILKPNIMVAFGNSTDDNSNKKYIGFIVYSISSSIAALITVLVSGYLTEIIGMKGMFILSLVSVIIATALFFVMSKMFANTLDTYKSNRMLPPKINKSSNLLILLSVLILISPLVTVVNQSGISFNLISSDLSSQLGNLMSKSMILNPISGMIAGVIIFFIILQLNKRIKLFKIISLGLLIYAIAYIILTTGIGIYDTNVSFLFFAFPVIMTAIGEVLLYPAILTSVHGSAPTKLRGLFIGIYLALFGMSNFMLGKFIELYYRHGNTTYLIVIALLLTGFAVVFFVLNIINNKTLKYIR